jgi:hypothetical protein
MGCAIFFKQCQEVNTVARQLLLGTPNTIEEEVIRRTFDEELKKKRTGQMPQFAKEQLSIQSMHVFYCSIWKEKGLENTATWHTTIQRY